METGSKVIVQLLSAFARHENCTSFILDHNDPFCKVDIPGLPTNSAYVLD